MSLPEKFRMKNCFYLFSKHTVQHIISLLTLFNVSIHKICQKIGGGMHKIFDNWKIFEISVIFGVNLRHLHRNITFISSLKTTGQPTFSSLTLENLPIYEVCRNFKKTCMKILKLEIFGVFVNFGVNSRHFHLDTAINFSKKPTVHHNLSLLALSKFQSILMKKCIKSLKNGKFWDFCNIRCQFENFFIGKEQ